MPRKTKGRAAVARPASSRPRLGDRNGTADRAEAAEETAHFTADQVRAERLSYLWEPYLPFNAYSIIEGDEQVGKSLLAARLIADVTGGPRIDGGRRRRPGRNVLYLPSEENLSMFVVPRLKAAGADLSRVSFGPVEAGRCRAWHPQLPKDLNRLAEEIARLKALLVVMEPLVSFFQEDCDANNYQQSKRVVDPLNDLAGDAGACIVTSRHWTKAGAGKGVSRGMGSRALSASARAIIQLGRDDSPEAALTLLAVKYAAPKAPPARRYEIVPGKVWSVLNLKGEVDMKADELSRAASQGAHQKMTAARLLLRHRIGEKWVASADIVKAAKAEGISDTILYEAKAMDKVPNQWNTKSEVKFSEWGPPKDGWPDLQPRR